MDGYPRRRRRHPPTATTPNIRPHLRGHRRPHPLLPGCRRDTHRGVRPSGLDPSPGVTCWSLHLGGPPTTGGLPQDGRPAGRGSPSGPEPLQRTPPRREVTTRWGTTRHTTPTTTAHRHTRSPHRRPAETPRPEGRAAATATAGRGTQPSPTTWLAAAGRRGRPLGAAPEAGGTGGGHRRPPAQPAPGRDRPNRSISARCFGLRVEGGRRGRRRSSTSATTTHGKRERFLTRSWVVVVLVRES